MPKHALNLPLHALAAAAALALAAPAAAQSGAGSTGAQVLQMPAGSRAAALSGAYAAAGGDPDVLFYNPAGLASLDAGGAVSYERFVQDVSLISASGALRVGPLTLGAGGVFLNEGSIDVVTPDPAFGGQRGQATGESVSASESAARLSFGLPLMQGRLRLGAGAGFVSTSLAGQTSGAPLFDAGAQFVALPGLTLGASLRNLGGSTSGAQGARLPTEGRAGVTFEAASAGGLGVLVSADYVARLRESTGGLATGIEAGLFPARTGGLGAVARLGYDAGQGAGGLGAVDFGGGLTLGRIALDYTYQNLDFFGAVHRFGVRIARGPR